MEKIIKKTWAKFFIGVSVIIVLYLALLCFPQMFFNWSVSAGNLKLYSDRPFLPEAGKTALELAQIKLESSPLYSSQDRHSVYVCNARWRQRLFFNYKYGVGGVNYYPLTSNVFLRDAKVEENRLISPSGKLVPGTRTLDYFIAHEIAHTLTGRATGWSRFHLLSEWVREGYADYVAKGQSFNYEEATQGFLSDLPEMDHEKSGLYLRYHLLIAYLLNKKHLSVEQVLEDSLKQSEVEKELREDASVK